MQSQGTAQTTKRIPLTTWDSSIAIATPKLFRRPAAYRQIPAEDVLSVNFTEIGEPAHPNHLRGPLLRGWQPPEAHREDHQIKVTHNPYGGHLRSSVLVVPGASRR